MLGGYALSISCGFVFLLVLEVEPGSFTQTKHGLLQAPAPALLASSLPYSLDKYSYETYFLLHCAYRYKVKLTAFTENRPLSPKLVAMKRNNSSIFSAPLGFVAFSTCDSLSDIETDISPELECRGKEVS